MDTLNEETKKNDQDIEDEVTVEQDETLDDSVVGEENAGAIIKKLRAKLKETEKEKQEYLIGWQRIQADMVNLKKREDEDRRKFAKFANEQLIEELMPVLGSFHMAFGNKESWEKVDKNWRLGVEYIYSQLVSILEKSDVKIIDPKLTDDFDPTLHESVAVISTKNKKEDHKILEVMQKGYSLHGKVLQPAKVKVGEYSKN